MCWWKMHSSRKFKNQSSTILWNLLCWMHLGMCYQGVQGDLEHFAQGFGLEVATSKRPCPFCAAGDGDIPWTDAKASAKWRATCYQNLDHQEWLEDHQGVCSLFQVPGVTISTIKPDIMHTKHLGVDAYILGSFFNYCCAYKLADSEEKNMQTVWQMIQQGYKEGENTMAIPQTPFKNNVR